MRFKNPIITILISSLFLISTCTNNDSVTGNTTDGSLNKPSDYEDIFGTNSNDSTSFEAFINLAPPWLRPQTQTMENVCFIVYLFASKTGINDQSKVNSSYDFRDNYLAQSDKGIAYIYSYYFLSEYGIENNLVMKYPMEHLKLMNLGIEVSRELQYGADENKILINRSTYDDCKNIVQVYRESDNHTEIDFVLDYLETDLEEYYNKTKAEIAAEFE